ncbi:MAG: hypothetical protein KDE15_04265 [Erythrobacter sp.]|nr:hypothetical protein [Erythrobacter sp.]
MPAFFLTFLAVAMAMLAGRDAVRVARLKASLGWTGPLLATVLLAAAAGAGLASWIADSIAPLIRDSFKPVVVAIALGLAGAEVLLRDPPAPPREPTRSMGAITLVLLLGMVTDASGFIILSLALATNAPLFAAAGGALGAVTVLTGAIVAGDDWHLLPLRAIRLVIGSLLLVAAVLIVSLGWH